MPPETISLLLRYENILKLTYTHNPYFKSEYEYKQEVREKIKEIKNDNKKAPNILSGRSFKKFF